ncbi:peptidyl-prolyl cis-trans isomerase CYP57 [Pyrus ussuriensis x Pyrus communis]|uniref:Peptidyl-prolyl cis-trans isomerase CYP57 n=1 Tax=Pyrus ussuriensis x Pyrus communis TaxID=2448454 RepID=A0A5N5HNP0_9ROSA|nr:peptidyl-prolyl cis-trans isomerase CYP57 [Pyrus ussuriensis x Pyrus communis]
MRASIAQRKCCSLVAKKSQVQGMETTSLQSKIRLCTIDVPLASPKTESLVGLKGESIYGGIFPDEFHSRLRFKHRGLVACANAGTPNSNGSQFFMNLDRSDWLDKKHTIFGKVTGDSIYNLVRLGELETDKEDRPLDPPPRILSVEVLWNPLDDIVPRVRAKPLTESKNNTENKDTKKKALNLLSFGEEAEEEEKELAAVKTKIKSSHDVLDDPRLLKEEVPFNKLNSDAKTRHVQLSIREALSSKKEEPRKDSGSKFYNTLDHSDDDDDDEANFDARMRQQILKKRTDLGDLPPKPKLKNGRSSPKQHEIPTSRSNVESIDDDQQKDHMSRNEDLDDYVVHDPFLEKGKEKFNRLQAKQKRRELEWAGKSLT